MSDVFFLDPDYAGDYVAGQRILPFELKFDTVLPHDTRGEGCLVANLLVILLFIWFGVSLYYADTGNLLKLFDLQTIISVIERDLLNFLLVLFCFFLPLFGLVAWAWHMAYVHIVTDRRFRRLYWNGYIINGELIEATDKTDEAGNRTGGVTVTYTFITPDGFDVVGRQSFYRSDLKDKKLPRKGTRIQVLYVDHYAYVML